MAIYSLNVRMVCRSKKGKTAVGKAAYIGGRNLTLDGKDGKKKFNYTTKAPQVAFSKILVPENSPQWSSDPALLWNNVEAFEKRKDAQVGRELIIALPKELSLEKNIELIEKYIQENFISKGMIADINIHKIETNPHVHVLLTTRKLSAEGVFGNKEREWNSRNNLKEWRYEWEMITNQFLKEANEKARISRQSYAERNILQIPTLHVGTNKNKKMNSQINKVIGQTNSLLNQYTKSKNSTFFSVSNEYLIQKIDQCSSSINELNKGKIETKKIILLQAKIRNIKAKLRNKPHFTKTLLDQNVNFYHPNKIKI